MFSSNSYHSNGQLKKKLKKPGQVKQICFQNHKNDHGQTSFASHLWTESDFSSVQNNVFNGLNISHGSIIKTKTTSEYN